MRNRRLVLLAVGLLGVSVVPGGAQGRLEQWVGTWATADTWRPPAVATPQPAAPPTAPQTSAATAPATTTAAALQVSNQTLRQIVHTSISGERVRVVLSNSFGTLPMAIGAAHVALRDKEASVLQGSVRALTFGGRSVATIPAGAVLLSDPVALTVPALADVAIDLFLPGDTATWSSPLTFHGASFTTNYISGPGNFSGISTFPVARTMTSWWLLSRLEVATAARARAIVTFGDSITDGTRSTVDAIGRWPDELARRLHARSPAAPLGIVNAGIAGNRLLSEGAFTAGINALARFDRDVLAQPGAAYVVVLEGINDIGNARDNPTPGADDLIAAYRQLIDRAHEHGLTIVGATLTPFEGAAYFTQTGEAKRQAVNQWIRSGNAFDGVIDFDAVIRDPASPSKFLPAYNSGDSLHPNDAGYQAMGQAIDLALFK